MNHSSNSRSNMFLMEMIVAILFFSLVSAICLRMFTRSHQMGQDTRDLNIAVNQASSAAALLRDAYSPGHNMTDGQEILWPDSFLTVYPNAESDTSVISIYFDENWNHCAKETGAYCMEIVQTGELSLLSYQIDVWNLAVKDEPVYSLDIQLHHPNRP